MEISATAFRSPALRQAAWLCPLLAGVACAASSSHGNPEPESAADSGTTSHDSGPASSSGVSEGENDAAQQAESNADAQDGPSPASSSGGSTSCSSLPLCDSFESDAAGMAPTGWTVVMGCNSYSSTNQYGTMDGPASGGGLLVGIDNSTAHSGSNSLRVVGGDSCGYYAENTSAFSGKGLGPQYYARFWARFSMGPTSGHNGFLSMNTTSTASQKPDLLRLGFQNNVIEWNWYGTDATLPDTDSQGAAQSVAPMQNTWVCLEFHIDTGTGDIEFWYNGNSATTTGLSNSGTASDGYNTAWIGGGWKAGIAPTSLGLGWGAFNGGMMTVWFDDVALGSSRIGCD